MSESLRDATHILLRSQSGRLNINRNRKEDQRRLIELLTKCGDGSLFRGWRREFEQDGDFEIDFPDYVEAVTRLHFAADTYLLFGADDDHRTLTLLELAPFEGQLIQRFKEWIDKKFDSHKDFFAALRPSKASEVSRQSFYEGVTRNGFDAPREDIDSLFDCCDPGDAGFVKQDDLIFLALDPSVRAQEFHNAKVSQMLVWKQHAAKDYIEFKKGQRAAKESALGMSSKHRLAPRPWVERTFELMPTVIASCQHQRLRDAAHARRRSRIAFLEHLTTLYGNEVRALRLKLAPPGGYSFSNMALRNYCRRLNLDINPRDLWGALDKDNDGFVTVEELSVSSALALASFQKWARRNAFLGSCLAIWDSPEAANASRKRSGTWYSEKKMLMGTFQDALRELGWDGMNNPKTRTLVFNVLDSSGCGLVTRADLDWVDKWRPVEWVYAAPSPEGLKDIKDMLVDIYGHPLRAWRCLLDQDDSNNIDYKEFKNACQRMGFRGNVAGAWRALDVDLIGRVSMKQFDLASAELLASFKEWAEANFGSVKHFFKTVYSGDNHAITLQELKRICHKLHWHGDVQLLFDCLDVDKKRDATSDGKRSLTCDELAFLDTWHVEPTEEELKAEELALNPPRTPGRRASHSRICAITERLTTPILGRGRRTLADLDLENPLEGGHSRKSLVTAAAAIGFLQDTKSRKTLTTPDKEVAPSPCRTPASDGEISQELRPVEKLRKPAPLSDTEISRPPSQENRLIDKLRKATFSPEIETSEEDYPDEKMPRPASTPDSEKPPGKSLLHKKGSMHSISSSGKSPKLKSSTSQRSLGQLAPLKDEPKRKQIDPRFKESAVLFESAMSAASSSPTFGRQAWASKKWEHLP